MKHVYSSHLFVKSWHHKSCIGKVLFPHELMKHVYSSRLFVKSWHHKSCIWKVWFPHELMKHVYSSAVFVKSWCDKFCIGEAVRLRRTDVFLGSWKRTVKESGKTEGLGPNNGPRDKNPNHKEPRHAWGRFLRPIDYWRTWKIKRIERNPGKTWQKHLTK